MTLQNLTEEVLLNFTHNERGNGSFLVRKTTSEPLIVNYVNESLENKLKQPHV